MKFIHIADVHYGMNPDSGKPWSRERAQAIRDTFSEVIHQAKVLDVDLLLIAGDLFHRQPLTKDLKEVNYLFSTIPSVRVVLIAGNHDCIRPNSALTSFRWSPNVTWLAQETMQQVRFEDIRTVVHGFSYHSPELPRPLLDEVEAPEDSDVHILLAHGGDANHVPFDKNGLAGAGFAYTALGHIHKPELLPEKRMAFPGSPEPLDKTETGEHGMVVGEIHPTTKELLYLRFVPLARAQYVPLVVNVTKKTTNTELISLIQNAIQKRGSDHIYRFRIRGMRDPDIEFDLEALDSRLRIVEIVDESEPQYNFSQLFAEHPSDMIGFYIRALEKESMSPVEKKALYYGIHALLRTTDERS